MSWWNNTKHDPIRIIRDALHADRRHLSSAPLGPRQRKDLEGKIAFQEAELKKLRKRKRRAEERIQRKK